MLRMGFNDTNRTVKHSKCNTELKNYKQVRQQQGFVRDLIIVVGMLHE